MMPGVNNHQKVPESFHLTIFGQKRPKMVQKRVDLNFSKRRLPYKTVKTAFRDERMKKYISKFSVKDKVLY